MLPYLAKLLLGLRCQHHIHLLTIEFRHQLYTSEFLEVVGKTEKKNLTLLLEDDRATTEEYVCLNLSTLLEEVLGVLEFEVLVVVVGLWTKTNLLDHNLHLLSLDLLSLTLLLVKELLVVGNTTYWRLSLWRDLDKVEFHLISQTQRLLDRKHQVRLNVLAYNTHCRCCNLVVDAVRVLLLGATTTRVTLLLVAVLLLLLVIPLRLWAWAEWILSCQIS